MRWPAGLALLVVALCAAAMKARYQPSFAEYNDGAYYVQIARHVAEGNGLLTSFSVFHQGLDPLPQKTVTYPLWPLVLGWSGRVLGLERAATLVPELLYGLDLLLTAVLVARVGRRLVPAHPHARRACGSRGHRVARDQPDVLHVHLAAVHRRARHRAAPRMPSRDRRRFDSRSELAWS